MPRKAAGSTGKANVKGSTVATATSPTTGPSTPNADGGGSEGGGGGRILNSTTNQMANATQITPGRGGASTRGVKRRRVSSNANFATVNTELYGSGTIVASNPFDDDNPPITLSTNHNTAAHMNNKMIIPPGQVPSHVLQLSSPPIMHQAPPHHNMYSPHQHHQHPQQMQQSPIHHHHLHHSQHPPPPLHPQHQLQQQPSRSPQTMNPQNHPHHQLQTPMHPQHAPHHQHPQQTLYQHPNNHSYHHNMQHQPMMQPPPMSHPHHIDGPPPPMPNHLQQPQQHMAQQPPPPPETALQPQVSSHQEIDPMGRPPYASTSYNTYCGSCQREILQNEANIICDAGCKTNHHVACSGLIPMAYEMIMKESQAKWVCGRCVVSERRVPHVIYPA